MSGEFPARHLDDPQETKSDLFLRKLDGAKHDACYKLAIKSYAVLAKAAQAGNIQCQEAVKELEPLIKLILK